MFDPKIRTERWLQTNKSHIAAVMEALRLELLDKRSYTSSNTFNTGFRTLSEMQLCEALLQLKLPWGFQLVTNGLVVSKYQSVEFTTKHVYALHTALLSQQQTVLCITPGEFIIESSTDEPFVSRSDHELLPGERLDFIQHKLPASLIRAQDLGLGILVEKREVIKTVLGLDYTVEPQN